MDNKIMKIAITDATSPIGKALKGALPDTALKSAKIKLFDLEELEGTLTEYDGGVEILKKLTIDSLETMDLVFLCGHPASNSKILNLLEKEFGKRAPKVIDLCNISANADEVQTAHFPRTKSSDKNVVKLPLPLATATAQIIDICKAIQGVRAVTGVALLPVSEFGNNGIESLHNQMVELVNFGEIPKDIFHSQLMFNIIPGLGNFDGNDSTDIEKTAIDQIRFLLDDKKLPLQLMTCQMPVFFSIALVLNIDFVEKIESERLTKAFDNAEGFNCVNEILDGKALPGPLESTDKKAIQIARILGNNSTTITIWANFDNILTGAVYPAIEIALQWFAEK